MILKQSPRANPISRRSLMLGVAKAGTVASAGLVIACGTEPVASPAPASTKAPATIRFAAAGIGSELAIWTEVVASFNALGTGITVSYEPCTAGTASAQDCLPVYFTQFVGGSAPDVWRVDDEPLPFYADKAMYRELDTLFARDSKELKPEDFFPRAIAAMRYDRTSGMFGQGKLYGLPFNTGGDVLYVNKRLFKEAGINPPPLDGNWTIDDWLEMSRKVTTLEAGGPLLRTSALTARPSFRGNVSFLWARGADFLDAKGKWIFNSVNNIKAYEWFVDLQRKHRLFPTADDLAGAFKGNGFLNERSAMWLSYPNNLRELYTRPQMETEIVPFPKAIDGKRYTRETADGVGLPEGGKQPEPAWTFTKWLASGDGAKIFNKAGRAVPARRSAAAAPDFIRSDTPQREENVTGALDYSRLQPVTLMFNDAEQIIKAYENAMFDDKSPMPVSTAMQQLQDILEKLERDKAKPVGWEPKR
jgi:multiple sugar transport system substrate-binding protein